LTTRVRTGLRIPYELNTKLIFIAREMGISKNALILQILRDWVKQNDDQKTA
jgi:predicted HicB family RNase H-like nuclease